MTLPDKPSTVIAVSNKNKRVESRNEEKHVKLGISPCMRVRLIPGVIEKPVLKDQ